MYSVDGIPVFLCLSVRFSVKTEKFGCMIINHVRIMSYVIYEGFTGQHFHVIH